QTPLPSFEVASVRPFNPQGKGPIGTNGGPGTRDPGLYTGRGMTLTLYLCVAFNLADCEEQIRGPGWLDTEKYDVAANVPPGTTKAECQQMLQNLLIERFRMVVHHETKMLSVYELVVAKNGSKLKESAVNASNLDTSPAGTLTKIEKDGDGFPLLPAGR